MSERRILRLPIDAMSHGPDAIGRHQNKVLFIGGGAPGDVADVAIVREEARFARAVIERLHSTAPARREPGCRYVGRCGGCQWQHLTYTAQLEAKQRNLVDHLVRIGGLVDPPVRPILASPQEWHYRHRINLRVDQTRLGFYRAESHEVVEIASCPIAAIRIERGLVVARRWLAAVQTTIRRLALVVSEEIGGIVLVANAQGAFAEPDHDLNARRTHPVGPRPEDGETVRGIVMFGKNWRHNWGDVEVSYVVDGMRLTSTGGEFTQVNLGGNRLLLDTVLTLGQITAGQRVLDLFCGAGNLTLPVARRGAQVTGVERSPRAIADARANATRLGLDCRFVCASAEQALTELGATAPPPDLVILDPPRGGASAVVRELGRLNIRRIVYVSCDPPTLARDLAILTGQGYRLEAVQPLDLFPHTYHLEAIAALSAPRAAR
jgi:23S rRNA (uracil1939-C5)-methyltransferase